MKSLLFSLLALCTFFSCESARETINPDQVPAPIQQAFTADHPNTKVAWEVEDDGSFEAEFKVNGEETSANYSATGELLETEVEIKKKALPAAVMAAIAEQFPDQEIDEAARVTNPDGQIAYEAELEGKDNKQFEAIFSADGTLLKRVELDEEDDKD